MQFTLIQQNDIHGCFEMHDELFWGIDEPTLKKAGGFSRIRQYVKNLAKRLFKLHFGLFCLSKSYTF